MRFSSFLSGVLALGVLLGPGAAQAVPQGTTPVMSPQAISQNAVAAGPFVNLNIPTPTLFDNTVSTKTRSATSLAACTTSSFPTPLANGQKQGLSVAIPANDTFSGCRMASDFSGALSSCVTVGLHVYLPNTATNGAINGSPNVRLTFSADSSTPAGSYVKRLYFTFAPNQLVPGWQYLTVSPSGTGPTEPGAGVWTSTGGMLLTDPVNFVEVDFGSSAGGITPFVAQIVCNKAVPMAALMMGFDDMSQADLTTLAVPILTADGIPAYIAGDGNVVPMNYARLQTFKAGGGELITQGYDHTPFGLNSTNEGLLPLQHQQGVQALAEYGLVSNPVVFAYPLSSYSTATTATLNADGVLLARSAVRQNIPLAPWGLDQPLVGSIDLGGMTLAQAKTRVDSWVNYGESGIIYVHDVIPGGTGGAPPSNVLQWYVNDYQALADYIAAYVRAGKLVCLTPSQWLSSVAASSLKRIS